MSQKAEPRFNVYIVSIASGEVVECVGTNLTAERADLRVMTALSRIDTDGYFVADYEVGSDADVKAAAQIAAKKNA